MVTNSFGKRKFMQPMGRPKHALKVPCFFSFQVLGQGEGFFFFIFPWFPSCSHYVPQVPNEFPNMFSIAPHFYSIMLWQMLSSFHLYTWAKGKEHCTSKLNLLWGASIVSFFLSDGPIKLAHCNQKKKTELGRHFIYSHLEKPVLDTQQGLIFVC